MRQALRQRRPDLPTRVLFGTTLVVGASVLGLVAVFLLRQESVIHRQYELRAEASANAIARESQFALLVGDAADLKRMAEVAVAGSQDVLYMVVEDASGEPIAAAHRSPLTARTVPGGTGGIKTIATRLLKIGPNSDIECIEASVPAVAQPEGEFFSRRSDPQPVLGRIRLGMSLQARHAMLVSSMRYAAAIGVLIILAGSVAAYFQLRQKRAEAKFLEAEERLSFLVSLSPAVLYSCEFQHQPRMTFVADNVREVLGYDPEQFAEAEFFRSNLHPEDRPRAEAMLEEMRHSGQHIGEYRFLHRDGKYRWLQDHRKIAPGASGRPAQLVGLLFDVTEKMEAAVALRNSELRYRELTEMLPETVFECDADGKLTITNQSGLHVFGISRGDLEQGVNVFEMVVPENEGKTGISLAERLHHHDQGSQECTVCRKDGRTFPAAVYTSPILSGGGPAGLRGLLIDVTQQRQAEEARREWARLVETSNDAVIKIVDTTVEFWNAGAERIYGYSAEEMLGHSIAEIAPEERLSEDTDLRDRVLRGEVITNFTTQRLRKGGQLVDVSLSFDPLHDPSGHPVGCVCMARDITADKEKERELLKRNSLLELLQASAVAANQAVVVEEALQRCLDLICSYTGWPIGHAFLMPAGGESVLGSAGLWHVDEPQRFQEFRRASEQLAAPPYLGLPGRVLTSGKPCWVADLAADEGITRRKLATDLGLKAAFASPVLAGSEVVGLLEFFSPTAIEADDPFLRAVTSIGVQLGRVVERTRAGRALKESEARYRAITENAAHGVLTMDEDGHILYANRTSSLLFGYLRAELVGMHVTQLLPEWMRESHGERLLKVAAQSEDTFSLRPYESAGLDKNGRGMLLEISLTGFRAKDNRKVGVAVIRDVSERKRAEDAVQKAHQALRAVIDTSPLAIVALDLGGIVQSWNLAAERMFGWRGDEVLGRPLPDLSDGIPADRMRRLEAGETLVFEGRRKRKDGSLLEVGVWAAPFRGVGGAVTGILVEYADLSARKLLEAQLRQAQKLESIGQLAAGLAHEINTPIQYVGDNTRFLEEAFGELAGLFEACEGVVGAASNGGVTRDLLDKMNKASEKADMGYLRGEIPKAIEQSLEGVARVAQIVKAMKEFSHPGSAELTAVDLNRAIESTILVCRNEWKYVAEMVTEFDAGLPVVPCLPGEMNQVILNLLVNASQAIADVVKQRGGKGTIKVSTRSDGEWAEMRIQDTGGGIPAAIRARVFDPFFTTKEVGKGTGQGLALAHSVVVQQHRGSITFETEEGVGTVFIIRLPLTESGGKP
ncbi:MAG TPA: PAS domain S-box protein [Terriglobales bacterium]|nr:PAS domain S-box protein [Terriglobales bacterium]